jgi:hypothetical protein
VTPRALGRCLATYVALLVITCAVVHRVAAGHHGGALAVIESAWKDGELVARLEGELPQGIASSPESDVTLVRETVVNEGAIVTSNEIAFALSLVAGRDGVKATLGDKTVYLTPDDLLARQAYDHGVSFPSLTVSLGADVPLIEAMLAERLGVTVPEVRARATIRRIRTERTVHPRRGAEPAEPRAPRMTPDAVTPNAVRAAALDAAAYLARGVSPDGHFRYLVDAATNRTLGGYDWPRHAGATYFLAQAYGLSGDPTLAFASLRAASLLRDHALVACGDAKCVGAEDVVDLGSSALALIALVEIVRNEIDPSYLPLVIDLARFVRQQQRADGEFMHQYDRSANRAVDVQFLYYSGEATLALARAHEITHDDALLDAARRGLAHLVGPAWSFFGDRYYFGEEHWTCQALDDLWARAPNAEALDFCERWHAYGRRMMYGPGESPFDADGAFGVGPIVTPRLTPVASRCEAAVATLDAAIHAGADRREIDALDQQLRRSLALLLREQFRPGPAHLFADPAAVHGAMPGSSVDWQLRIDYAQHAGSAMIRWLNVEAARTEASRRGAH